MSHCEIFNEFYLHYKKKEFVNFFKIKIKKWQTMSLNILRFIQVSYLFVLLIFSKIVINISNLIY